MTLIPDTELPFYEWWCRLLSGDLIRCGYGGASAPSKPEPITLPDYDHSIPVQDQRDYRERVAHFIQRDQDRLAALHRRHSSELSLAMRDGTVIAEVSEGSIYILDLLVELLTLVRAFYPTYRRNNFCIKRPEQELPLVADIVRLRLLLVAIRADGHIPLRIDDYIVHHLIHLLPPISAT